MQDKLKAKKRPTTRCRIFVGDPDEHSKAYETSFLALVELFKDYKAGDEMPEPMKIAGRQLLEDLAKVQEPYFQTFVFRAMKPDAFEKLLDVHPPRPNSDDIAYNEDTFPPAVFKECLIEPAYDTLTDAEWKAFFDECSHKEHVLLHNTALDANMRNIEPSTPKDLMTPSLK
ncbi:hypothetical protein ACIBI9_31315 [Nonomuraea sp. NPDC050451]|uniref:hypothetical protein n=1 Tax=Nonomuraea sp. NPDC050451 TaxID=3364364 RepID=UPI003792C021